MKHNNNLDSVINDHIAKVLFSCGGNVSKAARQMGINRMTIYKRLGKDKALEIKQRAIIRKFGLDF